MGLDVVSTPMTDNILVRRKSVLDMVKSQRGEPGGI